MRISSSSLKKTLVILLAIANMAYTSDHHAQQKTILTLPITISDNPPSTIVKDSLVDKLNSFGCSVLGISWPENESENLWTIKKFSYQKAGDSEKYTSLSIPLDYFDAQKFNPHYNKNENHLFKFPSEVPHSFIQELVNAGKKTIEFEKTTTHFILQNTPESLEKLGLKVHEKVQQPESIPAPSKLKSEPTSTPSRSMKFFIGTTLVGITGLIVWLLTTDDSNPFKAQILNFFQNLMPVKSMINLLQKNKVLSEYPIGVNHLNFFELPTHSSNL